MSRRVSVDGSYDKVKKYLSTKQEQQKEGANHKFIRPLVFP
jgi:hypothetical protein